MKQKSENQVKLAAAVLELKSQRELVKNLKLAVVNERAERKVARETAKAEKVKAKAEKVAAREAKSKARLAKAHERVKKAQERLVKLEARKAAPKALKRKNRKASAVKVLVQDGKQVQAA